MIYIKGKNIKEMKGVEILLYIVIISLTKQKSSFFELNFKSNINSSKIDSSTFMNEILFTKLSTNISIGTPKQIIPLIIRFKISPLSITSSLTIFPKNIIKYNNSLSSTFYSDNFSDFKKYDFDEFRVGLTAKENFDFGSKNINLNFILAKEIVNDVSGVLGLNLNDDKLGKFNILKQLKEKELISSTVFFFNFENTEDNSPLHYKGKLIIGAYPHEYNSKKYNKENYFEIKANSIFQNNKELYEIKNLEIYYSDEDNKIDFSESTLSNFDFSRNIIIGTSKFKTFITEKFQEMYNEKCKEKTVWGLRAFECDNDIDINKLKNIKIHYGITNYTFVLKPNDLFTSYNNKLYYLITFYPSNIDFKTWSFGITFLKKYNFVYDQEKKVIGFYNNKENDFSKTYLKIFLIISLIIIIILSSLYIHNIIFKKQRRIRANELEDNIDYIPYDKKT